MRVVFMGTPDFAVGALEAIIEAGHEVVAVVTQPDKPKGRGKEMQITPVKACAIAHNIPVLTPVKIKAPEAIAELKQYPADVFVVAAFGQILSKEILEMPPLGCVNIHASLLPKYRGAAPIQWAILDGEKETGVTIMQMNEGLDTGDILLQDTVEITDTETGESLFDKLAECGAKLIVEALPKLAAKELIPVKQNEEESSYAKILHKSIGKLDFSQPAVVLERKVRGLNSWPSAFTFFNGKTLKIWEAFVEDEKESVKDCLPGTVCEVRKDAICVKTGEGILRITSVQLEGKKRMETAAFLLGNKIEEGFVFTDC